MSSRLSSSVGLGGGSDRGLNKIEGLVLVVGLCSKTPDFMRY